MTEPGEARGAALLLPFPPREAAAPRTLAAIDVGSNSVKLLVARAAPGGEPEVVAREKEMVRLGHGTLQTGRLSPEALDAGVACLARFASLARAAGAERILCAATCAVREAENADELARRAKDEADLDIEVISGEEEARLITRAVRSDFPLTADPLLVIDIGGGSTEVIVARGDSVAIAESLEVGAVRLTDHYHRQDPMTRKDVRALTAEVDVRVRRLAREVRATGFRTVVGTSGTIEALADVAAALEGGGPPAAGHRTLTRKALRRVVKRLLASDERERLRIPGLEARRADIVTAGALLLLRLLTAFDARRITVCERSLREGLLLDFFDRVDGAPAASRDVRRDSVARLAERAQVDFSHAERTRDLALRLFDRTHVLHQLAAREREWLEHAAVLHDVGIAIGYRRHHRHSAYLIEHGGLKGFSAEEVHVLSLLARYHRGGRPRKRHEAMARLDPWLRPVVSKLAALLRLADALDRSHRQVVEDLEVRVRPRKVRLDLVASSEPELELWAAERKGRLFSRVFRRRLTVKARGAAGQSGSPAPEKSASSSAAAS